MHIGLNKLLASDVNSHDKTPPMIAFYPMTLSDHDKLLLLTFLPLPYLENHGDLNDMEKFEEKINCHLFSLSMFQFSSDENTVLFL